jgi:hypothetical protein
LAIEANVDIVKEVLKPLIIVLVTPLETSFAHIVVLI